MLGFVHRHLDPSESLLEILFGLIMALTMTAGARLLTAPSELNAAELAVALLGCNVAWGVIDAAFYLLGARFNRNRRMVLVRRLQQATDQDEAIRLVREEFDLEGEPEMRAEDRADFHRSLTRMLQNARVERAHLLPGDYIAAAIICVLVSLAALPGLVPLLFTGDAAVALRIANGLQVGLLLLIGYRWAQYSGANPWRAPALVGVLGVGLVLVAVALGG
ncbi:MAG: VIT family protein [Reyranella sp.]|nr:VIT family protein [Reyranella sp.]